MTTESIESLIARLTRERDQYQEAHQIALDSCSSLLQDRREARANTINALANRVHQMAREKGWYEDDRPIPELVALVHSELSEALESYRNGDRGHIDESTGKPEGVAYELMDVLIRTLDMCVYLGINVDKCIQEKIAYNATRSYRHGGKRC